jgi:uncharacterized protein YcaQ
MHQHVVRRQPALRQQGIMPHAPRRSLDRGKTVATLSRAACSRPPRCARHATAIQRLGFVQADPIRAPARAQDLTLRHRVAGYRAGDLERRYPRLAIEEDFFVNYGFLPRVPRTR